MNELRCSACGATTEAKCECGVEYVPLRPRVLAEKAIATNPEMSNRALAEEYGIHKNTVEAARKIITGQNCPVGTEENVALEEKRIGKDGKKRKMPTKRLTLKEKALEEFRKNYTVEAHAIDAPPLGPLTEEVREEIYDLIAAIHERYIKLFVRSRHAEHMSNELRHRIADDISGLAYNLRELSRTYLGSRDLRKITRPYCDEEIPLLAKDSNWNKKQ